MNLLNAAESHSGLAGLNEVSERSVCSMCTQRRTRRCPRTSNAGGSLRETGRTFDDAASIAASSSPAKTAA